MSKLVSSIRRAFAAADAAPGRAVHFHGGIQGAHVCDNPRCSSPALDPADA